MKTCKLRHDVGHSLTLRAQGVYALVQAGQGGAGRTHADTGTDTDTDADTGSRLPPPPHTQVLTSPGGGMHTRFSALGVLAVEGARAGAVEGAWVW